MSAAGLKDLNGHGFKPKVPCTSSLPLRGSGRIDGSTTSEFPLPMPCQWAGFDCPVGKDSHQNCISLLCGLFTSRYEMTNKLLCIFPVSELITIQWHGSAIFENPRQLSELEFCVVSWVSSLWFWQTLFCYAKTQATCSILFLWAGNFCEKHTVASMCSVILWPWAKHITFCQRCFFSFPLCNTGIITLAHLTDVLGRLISLCLQNALKMKSAVSAK